MKKYIISVLIITAMVLSSCAASENTTGSNDLSAEQTSSADDEAEQTDDETEGKPEESVDHSDGSPWIDSDLEENLSKDMKTDPGEDFHLYASFDWLTDNSIPDGYTSWSHYDERSKDVKAQCIELISDTSIEGHDASLLRDLNSQILDWDNRNKRGYQDIEELYERILSVSSLDELTDLLLEEADPDTPGYLFDFVEYDIDSGLNDSTAYYPYIGEPALLLSDSAEYSERTDIGDMACGYKKAVFTYMAQKLGMEEKEAGERFDSVISFETELAEIIPTSADHMQDDYIESINNERQWADIEDMSGAFPLAGILKASGLKYDGKYIVTNPDYIKKINEMYTEDNFEAIRNSVLIRYVNRNSKYTDRDTYDFANKKYNEFYGNEGTVSDEEMAYDYVSGSLSVPMQKVYVQKYGSEEDKKKIEDMCDQVINTYREMLRENEWASKETIDYAIKKLDAIRVNAAYPDVWPADYSDVTLDDESLIISMQVLDDFEEKTELAKLGTKKDPENWADSFDILSCNAFYSPSDNSINMIIGMMGEPFFSSDMSTEDFYASLGAFWIGHEVSHAFDSDGAQFDADGNLRNWWSDEDLAEFKKRVRKLDNYLDTIVAFNGKHIRGSNVDTEMLADITGLECALRMVKDIEGFDYGEFFKKYAQMNADLQLYSSELDQLSQDTHPLDYLRSNIPVQQFDEFYREYDVSEEDNMYLAPEERVSVW